MSKETNWKAVEARYGAQVVRFLKHYNVKLEVIGTGFYKIPNIRILNQCTKLSVTTQERVTNSPVRKKRRIEPPPEPTISRNCYALPGDVKRVINIDEKKRESIEPLLTPGRQNPSVGMNVEICLDELCKRRCIPEGWTFAETKKRCARWDHREMFERMMRTPIGRKRTIDYAACLNEIKPVLRKFEEGHKRFKYYTYLKIMLSANDEMNPNVSVKQIQTYFSKVFVSVVPFGLFGKNRNVKKLKKALRQYFLASWGETVCLKRYVVDMDIASIAWLTPIEDEETKWLIIAKVVKWLFEVFFVAILKSVFKVQKDLHSQKKNFLCSVRWKKCKARYTRTLEEQRSVVKKSSDPNFPENSLVPSGSTKLYPKKSGVRTICILRFDRSPEGDVAMLKSLLQQLYQRKYGSPALKEFHRTWLKYTKKKKANPDHKVYLVSADITDAYGSVNQNKLYSILRSMIDEIPNETLPLEWLAVLTPNNAWKRNRVEYKYWFSFDTTFPRIQSHALVTLANDPKRPKRWISKEHISSLLKAYILQQTVWYKGTEYIIKKGLAQGSPLSPVLSDIYYAHMIQEELGAFTKSGSLSRFVDDFLYITDDEESAKRTFVMRMRNFSSLKLTSIVLDTRINSSGVILSTASSAAHTMALRCVSLLSKIFDKLEPHVADIWDEIRTAVKIVVKMFVRRLGGYNKQNSRNLGHRQAPLLLDVFLSATITVILLYILTYKNL